VVTNFSGCAPQSDEYPAAAQRADATGTTTVRVNVDTAGKITSVDVLRSAGPTREHKLLDRFLVSKIMSACSAKPGTDENGRPVGASVTVQYVWKLD
jgi:protein TonB